MLQKISLGAGFISLSAGFALCVACGGGSDGGTAGSAGNTGSAGSNNTSNATFSSSLPATEQLGSISDQDSATLCKELSAFEAGATDAKLTEFSCLLAGILGAEFVGGSTDAALQTACKTIYDECLATPADTTTTCTKPDATCMATLGDLEACVNATGPYIDQVNSQIPTCDKLTQATLSTTTSAVSEVAPAACTAFKAKCPGSTLVPGEDL
jgi:hypothetical protein